MKHQVIASDTCNERQPVVCRNCRDSFRPSAEFSSTTCDFCPVAQLAPGDFGPLPVGRLNLTPEDIACLQQSFAKLRPNLELFAEVFYSRLFSETPRVRFLFTGDQKEQEKNLARMLTTMIEGLPHLEELRSAMRGLGERHVCYGVKAADYVDFGRALLWTLEIFLQDDFTTPVGRAWVAYYALLSGIMQGNGDGHGVLGPETLRAA